MVATVPPKMVSGMIRPLHMDIVWRRPVPTLRIKDPAYQEKMANIDAALARCDADNPVFYEDEVDIDLNPKLGADWMFRAQQKRVVTPGQNAKHYLAGVLHAGNGRGFASVG